LTQDAKSNPTAKPGRARGWARKIAIFVLKVAVAAGLVYWLIQQNRLDFASLGRLQADARTLGLFAAGGLSVFVGLVLLAWRLKILLAHRQIEVSLAKSFGLTLIGSFTGVVLPGLVGGDVVKAVYLCADKPGCRADAVAVVIADRVIGLYSLLLLGTLALGAAYLADVLPLSTPVLLIAPACVVVGAGMLALLAWPALRQSRPVQRLFAIAPRAMQNLLVALTSYVKSPRVLGLTILLSLLNHTLVVLTFIMAGRLLDDELGVFTHFMLNPLAMAMNAIAVTPGGIGLAEGAFSFLFEMVGSPNGGMVGLLGRIIQYGVFAAGGAVAILVMKGGGKSGPPV